MQFTAGEIIKGKVTGITNFGVFVDLGENKSGLVHISEVANSYVENINDILKIGDEVTAKILNIGDDGKISLSIKRALDTEKKPKREKKVFSQPKPDNSYTWTPKKQEPASFEEMMNQFKQSSDEKFSDLKRKNPDNTRSRKRAMK
ncbi:MAG: S1 RNA-binding domain-containing protein [Ruminococcaceae bacterium]|nr:S1 RNA-binding domain-containing protein [Oscillospiraceae bacterium]